MMYTIFYRIIHMRIESPGISFPCFIPTTKQVAKIAIAIAIISSAPMCLEAGPISHAACITACYAASLAAGVAFNPIAIAVNVASLGNCIAACGPLLFSPCP